MTAGVWLTGLAGMVCAITGAVLAGQLYGPLAAAAFVVALAALLLATVDAEDSR